MDEPSARARALKELVEALLALTVDDIEHLLREPTLMPTHRECLLDLWRQKMAIRTRARNAVQLLLQTPALRLVHRSPAA